MSFQSYQGSIFTSEKLPAVPICVHLSILSRFYFYHTRSATLCFGWIAFNPIKVLFLRMSNLKSESVTTVFQSYQGSIFTENGRVKYDGKEILSILSRFYFYRTPPENSEDKTKSFQSYQGSIFTHNPTSLLGLCTSFQSYQGSIFTRIVGLSDEILNDFQSYQGSIFTLKELGFAYDKTILSILSRFYFYWFQQVPSLDILQLSILSRFYFYERKKFPWATMIYLSILSRFYFYRETSLQW